MDIKKKTLWRSGLQSETTVGGSSSAAGSINRQLDQSDLISGTDINNNGFNYASSDDWLTKIRENIPLIVNTDVSSGPGIHWIVFLLRGKTVYVIDPLGPNNYRPYQGVINQLASKNGLSLKYFPGEFQFDDNSSCGWFSVYVAKALQLINPKDPFKLVEKYFGLTADDGDIKRLIKGFGMTSRGRHLDKTFDRL